MNILIIGSGGREHAFSWKIAQSPMCDNLYIAPGNAGTGGDGTNLSFDVNDFSLVAETIVEKGIDLLLIGPEAPLAKGMVDYLKAQVNLKNLCIIGPSQQGALLESSKTFAKEFMAKYNIPTAAYRSFNATEIADAKYFIDRMDVPIVLKADGLAAGKGVLICQSHEEAKTEIEAMLSGKFGAASEQVVVETFLDGREYSVFALINGNDFCVLPVAKDYKRIGEGDNGLNTGGMGAISPVSYYDDVLAQKTLDLVIKPTIEGIIKENIDYRGFVFFGMIEVKGEPFVIEYNCRMGDPETEAVIPRIKSDLVKLLHDCGTDQALNIEIDDRACAMVMLVSGGYPLDYEKGFAIEGLDDSSAIIFHAGTQLVEGTVRTSGGRVIAIGSLGETADAAIKKAYKEVQNIKFEKQYFRRDLGFDL